MLETLTYRNVGPRGSERRFINGNDGRPTLLFYCQHSLGIGHLTRSFALAAALSKPFRVVFLNGGRLPDGVAIPEGIHLIDLPPLGMDEQQKIVSRDRRHTVADARDTRRRLIEEAVRRHRPAVLLVELFPFGRKKFAGEILAMIRQTRKRTGRAPVIACSLRDILVGGRDDQQHFDDRARWLTDRYFDAVLVHSDPAFAKLEDSFHPSKPLRAPVHYTGFVVPARERVDEATRGEHVLISAGGGIVGGELFDMVLAARKLMKTPPTMRFIAGPFLPAEHWLTLQRSTRGLEGVEIVRNVSDMVAEMRRARVSISQCGYNTALDIAVAQVPALVVPYETETENEQSERASRLAALGAIECISSRDMTPQSLATKIEALLAFAPRAAALDLDGATRTATLLQQMHASNMASTSRELVP
jgi:predicted glycosyltransferase